MSVARTISPVTPSIGCPGTTARCSPPPSGRGRHAGKGFAGLPEGHAVLGHQDTRQGDCPVLHQGEDRHRKVLELSQQVGVRGFEPRTSSLSGMRSKPTELYALRYFCPANPTFYIGRPGCQTILHIVMVGIVGVIGKSKKELRPNFHPNLATIGVRLLNSLRRIISDTRSINSLAKPASIIASRCCRRSIISTNSRSTSA